MSVTAREWVSDCGHVAADGVALCAEFRRVVGGQLVGVPLRVDYCAKCGPRVLKFADGDRSGSSEAR